MKTNSAESAEFFGCKKGAIKNKKDSAKLIKKSTKNIKKCYLVKIGKNWKNVRNQDPEKLKKLTKI